MPTIGEHGSLKGETRGRRRRQPPPPPPITRSPFERPFAQQARQAQQQVRTARRQLPAPTLAAPPIIHSPAAPKAGGERMSRAEVHRFLSSQSRVAQAARHQIVASIRANVGNSTGRERMDRTLALMDEIATDPRLAPTRRAIRHYTRLEARTARPQTPDTARPGPAHTRVGPRFASIDITPAATALGEKFAQATPGLHSGSAAAQLTRNALKDVGTVVTAPFVGGYTVGKALASDLAAEATGRPATALTDIAGGVVKGTAHEVMHPGEAFSEHPLLSLLNLAGAASVLGKTAGAVTRGVGSTVEGTGVRGAMARAGSTVRPPLAYTDDVNGPIVQRTHSKDLGRKAVQVAADALREPVRDAEGNVVKTMDRGREVPVLKATAVEKYTHQRAEADFAASRANMVERKVREDADREMRVRGVKGRKAKDLVAMVVEGTITSAAHFMEDLKAERDRIASHLDEHERQIARNMPAEERIYRHSTEVKAARDRLKLVDEALAHPKIAEQRGRIVAAGVEIGRKLNETEKKAISLGLLHPGRALRARLSVTALAHQGARYFREPELRAMERAGIPVREPEALARHQAARDALDAADRKHGDVTQAVRQLAQKRRALVGAQSSRRGSRAAEDARMRAAADQGIAHVQTRVDDLGKQLDRLEVSMRRASDRGDSARVEELQGHIEVLGDNHMAAKAQLEKLKTQRGLFKPSAAATRAEQAKLARATALLKTARREEKQAYRDLHNARRKAKRTPKPPIREALRGPDGRFLPNKDIEDFLHSRGRDPETVAYLPHHQVNRGFFHQQFRPGRGTMDTGETRTGSAYLKGVTESSAELIRAQGVRQRIQIAKAQQIDRMIGDQGMKHPSGRYFTPKEARETADRLREDTGEEYAVVSAFPAKLDPEMRRMIRDDLQGPGAMGSLSLRLLNDRVIREGVPGDKGKPTAVLIPQAYMDRLGKHLQPAGDLVKFFQAINRPFRFAVLSQFRWLTGQFVEPFIFRLTAEGSGLNVFGLGMDIAASKRLLARAAKSSDPKTRAAAEELLSQQIGGLAIGGRGLSNRRGLDEFDLYRKLVGKLPAVQQGVDLLRMIGRGLMVPAGWFFKANRVIENLAQHAALGRDVRRDIQQFTGSWLQTMRLHGKAIDEAMKGLVDTPTQRRFLRSQRVILGKYEGFSPFVRGLVQTVMPFLPWVLNAARFTLWTMPAHHTALTAFLTKVNGVVAQDWEDLHKSVPPGSLKFAVPRQGGWLDIARYGPYGLTTGIVGSGGKDLETVTGQFLPQFSGAYAAVAHGEDPFGRPLRLDPSENQGRTEPDFLQRLGIALLSTGEASVPYARQIRTVREGGGTGYAGSNIIDPDVKPGTQRMSGVRRALDPLRPTYLTAGNSATGQAPGGVASGGTARERRAARLAREAHADHARADRLQRRAQRIMRNHR